MSLFQNTNNDAALTSGPPTVLDVALNGFFVSQDGYTRCTSTGAIVNYSQGLPIDANGSVCVSQTNAIASYNNGLPFDSTGRLCIAGTAMQTVLNGLPMDNDGKLCSLTMSALSILATYGTDAHLWLPGVGVVNGITAGNFIESNGTSPAAVDGPVGYVGDAGKALGAELVTNGDFSNGTTGWSVYNSSTLEVINGELKVTSTIAAYGGAQQSLGTHPAGKVFEVSWTARKGPQNQPAWLILTGVVGAPINNLVQTQTNQSYTVRVVSSGAALVLTCQCQNVAGTESFFDNISVREIVGAIPATQSTTANKPILRQSSGRYSWQFDGTDFLTLGSVPFQQADDHCVITAVRPGSFATQIAAFSVSNTSSTAPIISIYVDTAAKAQAYWRGDGGLDAARVSTSSLGAGQTAVVSLANRSQSGSLRLNGAQQGSNVSLASIGAASFNTASIGAWVRATTQYQWNGSIGPVIAIKGTVSDADLLTLEKWVGSLSGVGGL